MIDCPYRLRPHKDNPLSVLCTLTGRACLVDGEHTGSCLRKAWALEFEIKHGETILDVDKRRLIQAAKSSDLA